MAFRLEALYVTNCELERLALPAATAQLSSEQFSVGTWQANTVLQTIISQTDLIIGKLTMSYGASNANRIKVKPIKTLQCTHYKVRFLVSIHQMQLFLL